MGTPTKDFLIRKLHRERRDNGRGVRFLGDHSIAAPDFTAPYVDSKVGTAVLWVRNMLSGQEADLLTGATVGTTSVNFRLSGANSRVVVTLKDATGANVLFILSNNFAPFIDQDKWTCVMAAWDLAVPESTIHINDIPNKVVITETLDGIVKNSAQKWAIGANTAGANAVEAVYHQLYYNMAEFVDFSVEDNRRKFLTADLRPRFLGRRGELPTGRVPEIFVQGGPDRFRRNRGFGPDYSTDVGPGDYVSWSKEPVRVGV